MGEEEKHADFILIWNKIIQNYVKSAYKTYADFIYHCAYMLRSDTKRAIYYLKLFLNFLYNHNSYFASMNKKKPNSQNLDDIGNVAGYNNNNSKKRRRGLKLKKFSF